MKKLNTIQQVYFLGIGGIGMSALARYFSTIGKLVAGYDRTPTTLTRQLCSEGIAIHYDDAPENIPVAFRSPQTTWIIYTPAIPSDHKELAYFRQHGFIIHKRSEVLGLISGEYQTVAVAGTHGKTTVSTMIAHIMATGSTGCNAFLGGISKNFKNNLVLNMQSHWMVTEADEFDRSFLQLHPYAAVVTAMDSDHLDIYGNTASMNEAFNIFISQINPDGLLVMKAGLPVQASVLPARTFTYSLNGPSDFFAQNIHIEKGRYHFDLIGPSLKMSDLSLEHAGLVNVENAIAASAMTVLLGTDHQQIKQALATFSGIHRRFDYQVKNEQVIYIDDYAHHPREIEATLRSIRELYPNRKITGIFQPHLYSRTRDLAEDFASSLQLLDKLILLDIYPARELPIQGVSSKLILNQVKISDKILCNKDQLLEVLRNSKIDILVTLGAGDIDNYVEPITNLLKGYRS
jgi:UDP-N-acetylmuramate--alanine ligase